MRKSKQQAEAELQELCNKHLPEEPLTLTTTPIKRDAFTGDIVQPVDKKALLPRVGSSLPIDTGLVGCTQALFFERRFQTTSDITAPYCLKSHDHELHGVMYRSMYLIYISCDSEYEAAITLLGNYAHWLKLKKCLWFVPYLEEWNAELGLREQALAKSKLVQLTEGGNVTAARTLLTGAKPAPVGKPAGKGKRTTDIIPSDLDEMLDRTKDIPKH
jgi:hypothetical protein